MKYKEFIENNNRKKTKRVSLATIRRNNSSKNSKHKSKFGKFVKVSNGNQVGEVILNKIQSLEKDGFSVKKVVFKIFKEFFMVTFKVVGGATKIVGDAIGFIGGKLQMHYCGIKEQSKRNKFVNSLVCGAIAFLAGFCFTVNHLNNEKEVLANQVQELTVEVENNKKSVEIEIEDNTKPTTETANTITKTQTEESNNNNSRAKSIATSTPAFVTKLDESLKDIKFTKMDGDKTTNTIDIRYKDKETNEVVKVTSKAYGIGGFSTIENKKCVTDFIKYIKEVDNDFYEEYFNGVDAPGSVTFDTGWYGATKTENEKFKLLQINYIYNKYIKPTVNAVKKEYEIDLMSTSALKEFVFATAYDYGKDGTLTLFKRAGISSTMSEKEIIEKVQQEKINSLGVYTYLEDWKYTDKDRADAKSNIEKELQEFLALL